MTATIDAITSLSVTTSFVPFATEWPVTDACASQLYSQNGQVHFTAWDPLYYSSVDPRELTCLPPAITSWWFQQRTQTFTSSLGPLVCPDAYTTASASALNAKTAMVFCCPSYVIPDYSCPLYQTIIDSSFNSGYDFIESKNWATMGQCAMTLTSGQVIKYKSNAVGTIWVDAIATIKSSGTLIQGVHINGFVESQIETTPSSTIRPATNSATTSATISSSASNAGFTSNLQSTAISTTQVTSNTPANLVSSTSGSAVTAKGSGLSSASIVGIAVGIPLFIIISLLIAGIIFYRRRASKASKTSESSGASRESEAEQLDPAPPVQKYTYHQSQPPVEMDVPRYELQNGQHEEQRWELR